MLRPFPRCIANAKLYILILLISSAIGVNCYAQASKILSLDEVLQEHYLNSIDARVFKLQSNQDALEIENFRLSNLPSVSFNLNPVSFSQSIISLQEPVSGNFYYTNSFTNNSGLGLSVSQPLNFTGDINSALSNAENNGAQFNEYQIQKTEAERELYSAKLQRSFNGDINLSFGLNQYGDQLYKAYYKPSTQQSLIIGLRIPVFDWGVQRNKYEIAKSRYQIAILNTENQENNTMESVRNAVEDYNYNVKVIDVMKRQAELALKQYRLTVKMFASGNNTFNNFVVQERFEHIWRQKLFV